MSKPQQIPKLIKNPGRNVKPTTTSSASVSSVMMIVIVVVVIIVIIMIIITLSPPPSSPSLSSRRHVVIDVNVILEESWGLHTKQKIFSVFIHNIYNFFFIILNKFLKSSVTLLRVHTVIQIDSQVQVLFIIHVTSLCEQLIITGRAPVHL